MSSFTLEQYQALCEAIAKGVRKVAFSDREILYNSFDEMLRLKRLMETELADQLGLTTHSVPYSKAEFKRGR